MKKFFVMVIAVATVFAIMIPAHASGSTPTIGVEQMVETDYTINEFDYVQQLNVLSDAELSECGYSEEDIQQIRNSDEVFDEHVASLATLADDNLRALGYSNEQINIIRDYDASTATDSVRTVLGAECNVSISITSYTGTSGRVRTDFAWDRVPVFKMVDILATSWNNWYIVGKAANIKYVSATGTGDSFWEAPTYMLPASQLESYGSGYKFDVAKQDNAYYAQSGYSIFSLGSLTAQHMECGGSYGHQQATATLTYSINGVTITFSMGRIATDFERTLVTAAQM